MFWISYSSYAAIKYWIICFIFFLYNKKNKILWFKVFLIKFYLTDLVVPVNNSILYSIWSVVEKCCPTPGGTTPWKTGQFIVRESQQFSAKVNIGLFLKSTLQSTFPKSTSHLQETNKKVFIEKFSIYEYQLNKACNTYVIACDTELAKWVLNK